MELWGMSGLMESAIGVEGSSESGSGIGSLVRKRDSSSSSSSPMPTKSEE